MGRGDAVASADTSAEGVAVDAMASSESVVDVAAFSDVLQSEASPLGPGDATDGSPLSSTPIPLGAHKRAPGRDGDTAATSDSVSLVLSMPSMVPPLVPWLSLIPPPATTDHTPNGSIRADGEARRHNDGVVRSEARPGPDTTSMNVIVQSVSGSDASGRPGAPSAHRSISMPGAPSPPGVSTEPVAPSYGARSVHDQVGDAGSVRPTSPDNVLTHGRPETVSGTGAASPRALADAPPVSTEAGWPPAFPGRPDANDNVRAPHTDAGSSAATPLHAAAIESLPRHNSQLMGDLPPRLGAMDVGRRRETRSTHPTELRREDIDGPVMVTGAHKALEATRPQGRGASANPAPAEAGSVQPFPVTPARHDQAAAMVKEQPRAGALLAPIVEGVVVRQALLRTGVGAASFHIVLQPQALGTVTIHVEQTGQGMHVTLTPQHVETGVLLDRHASDLLGLLGADSKGGVSVTVLTPDGRHVGAHAAADAPAPKQVTRNLAWSVERDSGVKACRTYDHVLSVGAGASAGFSQGLTGGAGGHGSPMGQGAGSPWTGAEVAENAPRAATVSSAGIERSPVRPSRSGGLSGVTRIDIQI